MTRTFVSSLSVEMSRIRKSQPVRMDAVKKVVSVIMDRANLEIAKQILVGMRLFFVACALATASALRPSLRTPPPRASVSESTQPAPAAGRLPLALLAAAGAVETGAITADKLSGANALAGLCSAAGGGCADVLNSPWADVAGVPLALFGAIAYSAVALLAAAPLVSAELEEPSAVASDEVAVALPR